MMSLTMMSPHGRKNHTRPSNASGTRKDVGSTTKNTMRCVHASCRNWYEYWPCCSVSTNSTRPASQHRPSAPVLGRVCDLLAVLAENQSYKI